MRMMQIKTTTIAEDKQCIFLDLFSLSQLAWSNFTFAGQIVGKVAKENVSIYDFLILSF